MTDAPKAEDAAAREDDDEDEDEEGADDGRPRTQMMGVPDFLDDDEDGPPGD